MALDVQLNVGLQMGGGLDASSSLSIMFGPPLAPHSARYLQPYISSCINYTVHQLHQVQLLHPVQPIEPVYYNQYVQQILYTINLLTVHSL